MARGFSRLSLFGPSEILRTVRDRLVLVGATSRSSPMFSRSVRALLRGA